MPFRLHPKRSLFLAVFLITLVIMWYSLGKDAEISTDMPHSNLSHIDLGINILQEKLGEILARIDEIKPRISNLENISKQIMALKIGEAAREVITTRGVDKTKQDIARTVGETKDIARNVGRETRSEPPLPDWIETFVAPLWSDFKPWRGVFVILVTYRHWYLKASLDSIAKASSDINNATVCVFALDKPHTVAQRDGVNKTMDIIKNVTFCNVVIWDVNSDRGRPPEKNLARRLKYHWWFVLESVFNATVTGGLFDGFLYDYKNDILFIEEDTVLAPDFVPVMWFASGVKRLNSGIIQTALGGWSGENMINAHPDTFVVRVSRALRGIAYGLNQSTWFYFKSFEKDYFEDGQDDWCESMGLVLGRKNGMKAFRIVVPTLSRIWHIGKWGLGLGGDFEWARPVTSRPNWAFSSRLLELKSARVNLGERDLLGFLCKNRTDFWLLKDVTCPLVLVRWHGLSRNRIMCAKQPYVKDLCDVYVR